jgi:ribonuclease P protein component
LSDAFSWRRLSLAVQRLKTRSQFQAVLSAGSVLARTPHFVLHHLALDASPTSAPVAGAEPEFSRPMFELNDVWLGAMVPKRWAKRAVTRNAIKRQIYSVSSDFETSLSAKAHVVRLRAGFDRSQFVSAVSDDLKSAVRTELQQLFSLAIKHASPRLSRLETA